MKQNEYVNAVDKLEFSADLAMRVRAAAHRTARFRQARFVVLAAVLGCFMITTAFGTISALRERPGHVEILGTDTEKMTDAEYLSFNVSYMGEAAEKHYMELHPVHMYHFRHGMLRDGENGHLRVTEDYRLEPIYMNQVNLTLEKNERSYTLDFIYLDTAEGVLSNHRSVYHKNENGEILLNLSDGNSNQWPAYFNPNTGTLRDALPDWTDEDCEGGSAYGYELMGGILVHTVMNNGLSDDCLALYWIGPGAEEPRVIELPGDKLSIDVSNDTICYQNEAGQVYRMDENFCFEMICPYETMDYLQDGLLTVSAGGKLGILDAFSGELYVFQDIDASYSDTMDYHAIRYGFDGMIALTRTQWRHDPERRVLTTLGILNKQTAQLRLIEIENDYDGYQCNWLDEKRLAVVYRSTDRQFLCIYELKK